jgi:hypothetical protein
MLWVITPPGLEDFFRAIGQPRTPGQPPPPPFARPTDVGGHRALAGHERHTRRRLEGGASAAMPTLSIGDAELYYEDTGSGEPLLLVPGLSGRGSFWANQVAELSRDFRVVIHDHRGTGAQRALAHPHSVEQMADDVLRLMDGLGIEAAHLVGHSTGGAIGQVIALEHPGACAVSC